jgi:antitoxin component YwqK of YwqJK toxin-antitoxin module
MSKQIKRSFAIIVIILKYYSCFSQQGLLTVDSVINSVFEWDFGTDRNYKLTNLYESYDYKEGIDTLEIDDKDKQQFLVIHVFNHHKIKTELFDKDTNLVSENFFDTLRHKLYLAVDRNTNGSVIYTYENKNHIITSIDYFNSGKISGINVFNEEENHLIISMLFDSTGIIKYMDRYIDKKKEIHSTSYYPKTQQKCVEYFEGDNPTPYFEYYLNGKIRMQGKIIGTPINWIGNWQEYYPNGKLKKEYSFSDSIPNYKQGVWGWWDEKGNLIRQEIYKNNELIDTKEFFPKKLKGVEK